jgi:hypothetical protein
MSIPLELKGVGIFGEATDDPLTLDQEAPDAFEKFRADAELAGVAGGHSHVEKLRRETANVNERAAAIYKGIAAAADKTETKRLSKSAPLKLFVPLVKLDEEQCLVYGVCASETPDRQDEILDYAASKPYFQAWSESVRKDTQGKSAGNVREMHTLSAVGMLQEIQFDDDARKIQVAAKIVDADAWAKCKAGVYCGFSIGGRYVDVRKESNGLTRYIADPSEISLVDRPAVPDAVFQLVKAN